MCNCVEDLTKLLNEKYEDKGEFEIKGSAYTISANKNNIGLMYCSLFSYKNIKKDGSMSIKKFEMPVKQSYCPFCGKKYQEEESNGS